MGGWLCYTESWKTEDETSGLSPTRRTANCLIDSMNRVYPFLEFTTLIGEDSKDGRLASLNLCVQAASALSEEPDCPACHKNSTEDLGIPARR